MEDLTSLLNKTDEFIMTSSQNTMKEIEMDKINNVVKDEYNIYDGIFYIPHDKKVIEYMNNNYDIISEKYYNEMKRLGLENFKINQNCGSLFKYRLSIVFTKD